jgi:hypothetical protein
MSPKPSPLVAIIASLALAACSSIGTINGQRLDAGNPPPPGAPPQVHHGYPCEDFEFLCIVGVGGLIALIVVLATVKSTSTPAGHVATNQLAVTPPTPGP